LTLTPRSGEHEVVRSTQRDGLPNSVVDRAFAVLAAFSPADEGVSMSELARRSGIPKPTVHRLVHQLADAGALEILDEGVRVGRRLFELGQLAGGPRTLREAAAPFLADLHEATGQTVHLVVPDGDEVLYVQKLENRRSPSLGSRVGGRMPAYCTAVGKALLAHADPAIVRGVLRSDLSRRTPRTVVAPGLLEKELQRVRNTGIAVENEESAVGIVCVAAPVLDARQGAIAAVSLTGRATDIDAGRLAPAVRTAALGIARSLRSAGLGGTYLGAGSAGTRW
jgi:IclR family acetate operon transcriptional repressor